jgi:hypothetical protein
MYLLHRFHPHNKSTLLLTPNNYGSLAGAIDAVVQGQEDPPSAQQIYIDRKKIYPF